VIYVCQAVDRHSLDRDCGDLSPYIVNRINHQHLWQISEQSGKAAQSMTRDFECGVERLTAFEWQAKLFVRRIELEILPLWFVSYCGRKRTCACFGAAL
jgi:hypothetical protein